MPTVPRYLPAVAELFAAGAIPADRLTHALIVHDDGCGIFAGRPCDCEPEVSLHAGGCPALDGRGCSCGGPAR